MTEMAFPVDRGPHLSGPVTGIVILKDLMQRPGDFFIPDRSRRRGPGFKGVIGAQSNFRRRIA